MIRRSLNAGLVVALTSVVPPGVSAQQPADRATGVPVDTVWREAPVFTDAGFIVILPEAPYPVPGEEAGTEYSWGLHRWTPPPLTNDSVLDLRSSWLTVFQYVPAAVRSVEEGYRLGPRYVQGFFRGAIHAFLAASYNRDVFDGVVTFGLAGMVPFWFSQRQPIPPVPT